MLPKHLSGWRQLALCAALSCALWQPALVVAAESAPPPITIEADEATLQEQDGASVYRGHVSLVQGGLRLDAEEIRVESVDGKLSRMIASGTPVKYKQNRSGLKSIAAEADSIEYLAATAKAIFRGNAKLTQGNNSFSGDKIEYDASTDTVRAGSSGKGGVKIVIQPNGVIAPQPKKNNAPQNMSPNDGKSTPDSGASEKAVTPSAQTNSQAGSSNPQAQASDTKDKPQP